MMWFETFWYRVSSQRNDNQAISISHAVPFIACSQAEWTAKSISIANSSRSYTRGYTRALAALVLIRFESTSNNYTVRVRESPLSLSGTSTCAVSACNLATQWLDMKRVFKQCLVKPQPHKPVEQIHIKSCTYLSSKQAFHTICGAAMHTRVALWPWDLSTGGK